MPRDLFAEQPRDLFASAAPTPSEGYTSSAGDYLSEAVGALGNLAGGFVQGVGNVGTRLNRIIGVETPESAEAQRAKNLQELQQNFGYDPTSGYSAFGRFAGETVPAVGSANMLVRGAGALLPTRAANYLMPALQSAGFGRGLEPLQRMLGGGVTGIVSGPLAMDDPLSGAMVGGGAGALLPVIGPTVKAVATPVAQRVFSVAEPYLAGGQQAIVNRTIQQAFANDEQAMQQALQLLGQGRTLEEIAVILNKPVLAGFVDAAKRVNQGEVVNRYADIASERALSSRNRLLGAQQAAEREAQAAVLQGQQMVTHAEDRLQMLRRNLAANKTLTAQQRAQAEQAGMAEITAARDALAQAQQRAAGVAEAAAAERGAIETARQAEVGAALPERDVTALGAGLRQQARAKESAALTAVKAKFDEVREAGADITGLPVDDFVQKADQIIAEAGFKPEDIPKIATALTKLRPVPPEAPSPFSAMYGGAAAAPERQATANWQDLINAREAINKDLRRIADNPELRAKKANLVQLRKALDEKIQSFPDELVPAELKALDKAAVDFYKSTYVVPFRTGKLNQRFLADRNGEPVIPLERVVDEYFRPTVSGSGVTKANRFMDMLGDNPVAMDLMQQGIEDAYRRAVVKNGIIDSGAHAQFLQRYGGTLQTLRDRGLDVPLIRAQGAAQGAVDVQTAALTAAEREARALGGRQPAAAVQGDVRQTLEQLKTEIPAGRQQITSAAQKKADEVKAVTARGAVARAQLEQRQESARQSLQTARETARALPVTGETVAAEARALQNQFNVDPDKLTPTLVRDLPEAQQIVADIRREIQSGQMFTELASKGRSVGSKLLDVSPLPSVKAPVGITWEIMMNAITRRLSGMARTEQAHNIAVALMNEGSTRKLIQDAIAGGAKGYGANPSRVRNFLAPEPPRQILNNLQP